MCMMLISVLGKWDCPWHHCDECGKPAAKKCVECPNSFCSTHADDTKIRMFDNKVYCVEHEDLLDTLEESQSQASAASDDNVELPADSDAGEKVTNGKENDATVKGKSKEETLPPKKRGPKPQSESSDKSTNGTAAKVSRGRKSSVKGEQGTKGSVSDDPLAVAPMFDDDEEEEFGLVIDIPNF